MHTKQSWLSEVWDRTVTEIDTFNKRKTSPSSLSHFLWITKQKIRLYSAFKEVLNIFLLNQSIKGAIQFNSNVPNQFLNSWPDFLIRFCQENVCDLLRILTPVHGIVTVLSHYTEKDMHFCLWALKHLWSTQILQLTTRSIVNQNCLSDRK